MMDKPTIKAIIGGVEYPLYMNLYATEMIQDKFGDVKSAANKIASYKNYKEAIDTVAELIVILANQGLAYENFFNKDNQRDLLTTEDVKLLCVPYELEDLQSAILDAMIQGTNRNVESEVAEGSEKNSQDE